jgi:hypothetical protein
MDDCCGAANWLSEKNMVDPSRMFIRGGSYLLLIQIRRVHGPVLFDIQARCVFWRLFAVWNLRLD